MKSNRTVATIIILISFMLSQSSCYAQDTASIVRGEMFVQLSGATYQSLQPWTSPNTPHVVTSVNSLTALFDSIDAYSMEQMCVECTDSLFGDGAYLDRMFLLSYNTALDPDSLRQELLKNENIADASPNRLIELSNITPNDPEYDNQDWLQQLNAEQAWEIQTGNQDIKIAILDGMFTKNPDNNGYPDLVGKYLLYSGEN